MDTSYPDWHLQVKEAWIHLSKTIFKQEKLCLVTVYWQICYGVIQKYPSCVHFYRFTTGIQLNSHLCTAYIYVESCLGQMWLLFVQMEVVVHYIFLKNETFLLVVKEDLIVQVCYVVVFGIAVSCTFVKFYGKHKHHSTHSWDFLSVRIKSYLFAILNRCD